MDSIWALEHSQYSEDKGAYPYHVSPLKEAIEGNLQDCHHNNRGANKWQIVFIGPDRESCHKALEQLDRLRGEKWLKNRG